MVCVRTSSNELISQLVCSDACFLKFFPNCNGLEPRFDNAQVSEDDVARRQAEEDLRLYGNRPQPAETIDDYESADETKKQSKRYASEFELADQTPLTMHRIGECETHTTQFVTAMDWNSGASPLDSWLNQSAIPSLLPGPVEEPPQVFTKDLIERETEEIKVFRTVHVSMALAIEKLRANHRDNEDFANLSLGAQIYYRNIMDRYPQIPIYLARRLAERNLERAQRLENQRRNMIVKAQRKIEIERRCQNLQPPIPPNILPRISSFRAAIEICQPLTESAWELLRPQLRIQSLGMKPPEEQAVNQIESLRNISPIHGSSHEGFWQGGRPRRRPSSADSLHSRSSSMNSSLHGSGEIIATQRNGWMSGRDPETVRGLPPPPVDISKQKAFECNICGQTILVERRREWQ